MTDATPAADDRSAAPADLVVGLGASTGGLEALQSFFTAVPPDTGLAFVIVQHLDPTSDNLLPGLLSQVARIPVTEARDGTALVADHAYVAPPAATVRLEGDVLRVTPASGEEQASAINAFFFSLADTRQAAGVAIVLSGSGTDGALGLRAVTDAGGLTVVQDPATARSDSMPRHAATYGPADRVLPPDRMPDELVAYARHVRALAAGQGEALQQQIAGAIGAVCDVLAKATDHNFKHYKTSTLVRRIGRRMQVRRLNTADEYVELLKQDRDESAALFKELLIGVTAFFRDPDAFEALANQALPAVFANRAPTDPVRIWVPGCATGEEAYTVAMLVRERLDSVTHPPEVQIFATDINERALTVARQGAYPASIVEDVSADRLKRFFVKKGNQYHVVKEVRELCLFSAHDLIRDPPFSRLDLISCRNVLIYLGPHLQKKLIPLFHYALRPGGFLFLGPSETLSSHRDLFRPVNARHRLSQRLPTAVRSGVLPGADAGHRAWPRPPEGTRPGDPDLHLVMQRIVLDEFAPKSVVVSEDGQIVCASGGLEKYLGISAGTFQNNVIKLARTALRVGLRSAFAEAIKTSRTVVHDNITLKTDHGLQRVRLTVQPMPQLGEQTGLYLVVFQDAGPVTAPDPRGHTHVGTEQADALIDQLERELQSTRDDLEKTIQDLEAANEEMKSSNEELLSMNEELQSANEELETSKEEIQAANEALARANSDLENLLTSTEIATVFLDDDRRVLRFTPAVTAVYNLLPADVGRPLSDITHRARAMPPVPDAPALRQAGGAAEDEVRTHDGQWYIRRILPYRTHQGTQAGLVITFMDVTALKAAERAVRDQAEMLKLAPVLVRDLDDRIVFWDRGAEQMYGYTAAEAVGQISHDLLHTVFPRPFEELRAELLRAGTWQGELTHRRKDGSEIVVVCRWVLRPGADDRPPAILVVSSDITDRKRMEAALRDADREKDAFLAMLAHELRNPLAPVLNAVQLLRLRGPADPVVAQQRDIIGRQTAQMKRLLDDLLDVARISRGAIPISKQRVDLRDVLRNAVEAARPLLTAKGHELRVTLPDEPLVLNGDPTRLIQVFSNLLNNAAKYTEHGGRVWLTAAREADPGSSAGEAVVRVRDTGEGMTPEMLSRAFDVFSQSDRAMDRPQGGLGIGLTLVRRLVALHSGTAAAASAGPGKGSEFTIRLPLLPVGTPASDEPPASGAGPAARRRRILVVDDNVDAADSLAQLLAIWEHEVVAAHEGPAALRLAPSFRPEIVLLDIGLPRMNGYQVAREMRALPGLENVYLVALTGYSDGQDRRLSEEAGFVRHLMKPVDPDQIRAVLAELP